VREYFKVDCGVTSFLPNFISTILLTDDVVFDGRYFDVFCTILTGMLVSHLLMFSVTSVDF